MKHQRPTESPAGKLGEGDAEISLFSKIAGGGAKRQQAEARRPEGEVTQPAVLKPGRADKAKRAEQPVPPKPQQVRTRPVAGTAAAKPRHRRLALGFLLMVVLPSALAAYYLYFVADDQYASRTGFSVRKEEMDSAVEMLGGITNLSGSSSSDTDVLYEFIQSQELVETVDERLDLKALYSKPTWDPIFAFDPDGTIEDLVEYWRDMVTIYYDAGTGLIQLRVLAFAPEDAQRIAQAVFEESSRLVNEMTAIAREDATRYTRDELEVSLERLKQAREALTNFRSRTQMVDPEAELAGHMEVLNALQAKVSEARIELELLESDQQNNAREDVRQEVRMAEAQRRIDVLSRRLDEERRKFGISGEGLAGEGFAPLVAEYERLSLDREFAEKTYLSAFSAYNSALADAQRQSRYLAAYEKPTLPEAAQYPKRATLVGLTTLFLLLGWSILTLIYYSLRERR